MTTERNRGLQPWRSYGEGELVVVCKPTEWMVAVTEQGTRPEREEEG